MLDFNSLISLIGDRYGEIDLACPECGHTRKSPSNRERKVFRVWRDLPDFLAYHCCRCGLNGHARLHGAHGAVDAAEIARLTAQAAARDAEHADQQRRKAKWMWSHARPVIGTPAAVYLRSRVISCELPATLGFLEPHKPEHHPALIAAFGMAREIEPGRLFIADEAVMGVHLTLLKSDGSGKADLEPSKITIGPSIGSPIVLAPPNDLLGLTISEGVEDALSVHDATGLGAWASGSAFRLPALADAIPRFIDCVRIIVDDDDAGRQGAHGLASRVSANGVFVELAEASRMTMDDSEMRIAA